MRTSSFFCWLVVAFTVVASVDATDDLCKVKGVCYKNNGQRTCQRDTDASCPPCLVQSTVNTLACYELDTLTKQCPAETTYCPMSTSSGSGTSPAPTTNSSPTTAPTTTTKAPTTTEATNSSSSSSSTSTLAIALIVGGTVVTLIIAIIGYRVCVKRRHPEKPSTYDVAATPADSWSSAPSNIDRPISNGHSL